MIRGYARVSTRGQMTDGNGLQSQIETLKEKGCEMIYSEAYTGTKADRPQLIKLLDEIEKGDQVIVCKLDRLARSTADGLEIVQKILKKGCSIQILNMGHIDNTPTGQVILTVFLAFATFERDLIIQRTQEGKQIARQNPNFREGRPKKFSQQQRSHAKELLKNNSLKQVSEMTGISTATLSRLRAEQKRA